MEEFIPPSEQVAEQLVELLGKANNGEFIALSYVAFRPDGSYVTRHVGKTDRHSQSGLFLELAITHLGFEFSPHVINTDIEDDKE